MRVGQVTMSYKPIRGGAETYLANLYHVFEQAGHQQHVYQPDTGVDDPELVRIKKSSLPLSPIPNFNVSLLPYWLPLRHEDRLIIHYPEHFPPVAWHRRAITLTHGVNWDFDGHKKQVVLRAMARFAYQYSWKFVANDTNFLRQMGVKIQPKTKMYQEVSKGRWFIPNAIDTAVFKAGKPRPDLQSRQPILVPRNFSYPRGIDLAIDAFHLIAAEHPEVSLVLVGDALPTADSQAYKQSMIEKVKQMKLVDRVIFYGAVPWQDMPSIYASGICTLIPTRGNEGTSLSALESMSAGIPTVTTSVAGLADLPSYQVDPDPEAIAQGLRHVLKQPRSIGISQQQEVEQDYNLEVWRQAWLEVLG